MWACIESGQEIVLKAIRAVGGRTEDEEVRGWNCFWGGSGMLKSYFLVAWRGLRKNRVFSVINVVGLAIGLAVCMLIALYVTHELSYDRYHVNADRIYRLDADLKVGAMGYYSWDSPLPLGPALVKDFPDVETMARVNISPTMLVKKEDQTILEEHAGWADPSLFDVFTLPMLAGNPKTALAEPNTMVISERMAKKYFGGGDGGGAGGARGAVESGEVFTE